MSNWGLWPAPGGVGRRRERAGGRFVIYAANYYGHGEKLYLDFSPLFQAASQAQPMPALGGYCEGNEDRIRATAARFGVALPTLAPLPVVIV